MKPNRFMTTLLAVVLLVSGFSPAAAGSSPAPVAGLQLIRSDQNEAILELGVTDYTVDNRTVGAEQYQTLTISGLGTTRVPGAPQVPTSGALVGVPAIAGLSLQVLSAEYEVLPGYRLLPVPELSTAATTLDDASAANLIERYIPDPAVYSADQFYPEAVAQLGDTGYMGDQAVAQVRFYPVQYNPVRAEVRVYHHVVVRLSWPSPGGAELSLERPSQPAYEALLSRSLVNYTDLKRPAVGAPAGPTSGLLDTAALSPATVSPALKVGVLTNGVYRLTYTDVVGAGFAVGGLDPHTIKLNHRGAEIPILFEGNGDTTFDANEQFLFYGTAITDDIYTEKNIYWLTGGGGAGARMSSAASGGNGSTPTTFTETLHAESDTIYWQTMPNGTGQDHWFYFDRISPATQGLHVYNDYTFQLRNIITSGVTSTLRVELKGATNDSAIAPDHLTKFSINGVSVGQPAWDGFAVSTHVINFAASLLKEGSNTLRFQALATAAAVDQAYLNWFEITYAAQYKAYQNQLFLKPPAVGQYDFTVSGFNNNQIFVFDVTDPTAVAQITGLSITGSYQAEFQRNAAAGSVYLALTRDKFLTPASLELDSPSDWATASHGADYILITPSQFYTATLELATYRQGQGLRVAVVKVEDIYDEFNWGIFNPQAIRDFLAYAYVHWTAPAPAYVLLAGGASYDYRDKLSDVDRVNYVPSQMIETFFLGQTASDNWFVEVAGNDILPDMFIGRLTAESSAQVNDMIDKIIAYEASPTADHWNDRALFVSGEESSFAAASDRVISSLSGYILVDKVYAGQYGGGASPTPDITAAINAGRAFVNYLGHGDPQSWSGDLLVPSDIALLANNQHFPVVTIGNCLNGFFVGKAKPSMAEEFLKASNHGAVAVWAPTGLGLTSGHESLLKAFYRAILVDGEPALGAAATEAKIDLYTQSGFWGELVETYVLFGDPATQLVVPDLLRIYLPLSTKGN